LLKDQRRTLVFLFTIALMAKLILFIVGVTDNRVFDLGGGPPDLFAFGEVESFRDYGAAYLPTINAFKSGYTPYVDFWYAYPPLFLYLLTAFSYLPFDFWGPALSILIFDAFSVVPVYLIGLKFLSEKKSFLVSLLFTLAPINLFYNDYLWLNPPLVTFFALLATYFLLTKRYGLSALALGVSFGFKQTGLLLLPASSILIYKKADLRKALKFVAVCTIVSVTISMPYLLNAPKYYIGCLTAFKVSPTPEIEPEYYQRVVPSIATGITEAEATYPIRGNSPINSAFPIFVFTSQGMEGDRLFTYFRDFYAEAAPILRLALLSSFGLLLLKVFRSKDLGDRNAVKYLLLSLILFHSFYEGIYKYYYAMVTPFLALFMPSRIRCALFILFNFSTLLIPRFLSPWILFPFLIYIALKPYLTRSQFLVGRNRSLKMGGKLARIGR